MPLCEAMVRARRVIFVNARGDTLAVHGVLASACELLLGSALFPSRPAGSATYMYLVRSRHAGIAAFCGTAGRTASGGDETIDQTCA